jgi:hypothetical protein
MSNSEQRIQVYRHISRDGLTRKADQNITFAQFQS